MQKSVIEKKVDKNFLRNNEKMSKKKNKNKNKKKKK